MYKYILTCNNLDNTIDSFKLYEKNKNDYKNNIIKNIEILKNQTKLSHKCQDKVKNYLENYYDLWGVSKINILKY